MTMTVDGGGPDPNAAAQAAAAQRAAEEAARRAAEEAARAAEAAAVRAAALAASQQSAQEAQFHSERLLGAGGADLGAPPWAADDRNSRPEAAKRLEQGVSLDDLKNDPTLAKSVAALKDSPDPVVRAEFDAAAKSWASQIIDTHLKSGAGQDPKAVYDGIKQDILQAGQATGLAKVFADVAPAALQQLAIDTLNRKPSLQELQQNPAVGQLLATLEVSKDAHTKQQLHDLVKGYAATTIDQNLQGKQHESGVNQAVDATTLTLVDLGAKTGLGATIKEAAKDAFQEAKKKFEDTANKGKPWYEGMWDGVKNVVSSGTNLVGHGLEGLGSVTNSAIGALGDLAASESHLAANAFDVVGAHSLADETRGIGDHADQAVHAGGALLDAGLHTAGGVLEGGPLGLVNSALDGVLGPEKADYKGQIDGVTGAIANHLGQGDAVYLQGQAGAQVGVGVFAGGSLSGGATLSRGADGKLTLSLSVGATAEAGISAKTGGGATVEAGGLNANVEATASAEASATAGVQGKLNLTFDPTNPADVSRLKALLEPTPAKLALATVTVNPLAMAGLSASALSDAMAHNFDSAEGATTLGASATAKASAELGPMGLKADIGTDGVAGVSRKFYANGSVDTKIWLSGDVHSGATMSAGVASAGGSVTLAGMKALTVTRDKDGHVTGVTGEDDGGVQRALRAGVGQTHELGGAEGAPSTNAKTSVAGGSSDTTKHEKVLTAEGVKKFDALLQSGKTPFEAYAQVSEQAGASVSRTSSTHTDEFSLGGSVDAHVLGVGGTLSAKVTVGMSHSNVATDGASSIPDDNFNRNPAAHLVN